MPARDRLGNLGAAVEVCEDSGYTISVSPCGDQGRKNAWTDDIGFSANLLSTLFQISQDGRAHECVNWERGNNRAGGRLVDISEPGYIPYPNLGINLPCFALLLRWPRIKRAD